MLGYQLGGRHKTAQLSQAHNQPALVEPGHDCLDMFPSLVQVLRPTPVILLLSTPDREDQISIPVLRSDNIDRDLLPHLQAIQSFAPEAFQLLAGHQTL